VAGELAVSDAIMNRTFWVGVYPGLTEAMLDYLADQLTTGIKGLLT
jgi:CDP-6-deoxy-D-xylo-4-hexulose-3-dehydrase